MSSTVPQGEVFGFLGPSGAGKSTTMDMSCTLARPTSGTARVSGFDAVAERDHVRRHIGLIFQDPTLDGHLTATQNLRLHAELYGIDPSVIPGRIRRTLEMVDPWEGRGRGLQPIATMDREIVVVDTPAALGAGVGADRVAIGPLTTTRRSRRWRSGSASTRRSRGAP